MRSFVVRRRSAARRASFSFSSRGIRSSTSPVERGAAPRRPLGCERDGEAGGEDRDRDVVQARSAPLDLLRQPTLEIGGHPHEDVAARSGHASD